MAIGVDIIKTSGRLVFDLRRGEDETTRTVDIPNPITDPENVQAAVNTAQAEFTTSTGRVNTFIQPANWRDADVSEEQWITTGLHYEIVTTMITPVEPDEAPTVAGGRSDEAQAEERSQEERNEPQGEWQG